MRPFIVLVAMVLFLVGCYGDDDTDESSDAASGEPMLNDFIPGAMDFDEANGEQQYLQQEREVQERVAACMAEEGFEYVAYVPNADQMGFSGPDTEEEFVELYGFGIATMLLEDQGMDEAEMEAEMVEDPNYAIVNAMAEVEQEAYYAALHGQQPDLDFESMTEEEINEAYESFQPSGCHNEAYQEAFDVGAATGLIAGLYLSWRAASLEPIDALRTGT